MNWWSAAATFAGVAALGFVAEYAVNKRRLAECESARRGCRQNIRRNDSCSNCVECCADDDKAKARDLGAASSTPTGVRRSATRKPSRCDTDSDCVKPLQRESCSQPAPCATEPAARRSSKGLRSSFRLLDEECAERVGKPEDANTADPLSRQSTEGLRWISKPFGKEERDPSGSARSLGDEEIVIKAEQAMPNSSTVELKDDDNTLQPISAGIEEPVTDRGRSSLPSAPPSLISRQCLVVFCFSSCLLCLLFMAAVLVAYSRWVATPALTTPASNGDLGNSRQKLDDSSDCDSLLSFSHCADLDMFG